MIPILMGGLALPDEAFLDPDARPFLAPPPQADAVPRGNGWASVAVGLGTAQGPVVARHWSGKVSIDTGLGIVTGRSARRQGRARWFG